MILATYVIAAVIQGDEEPGQRPAEPPTLEIVVRDGLTGHAVPGAEVRTAWLPLDAPPALDRRALGLSSMDGWLEEVGERRFTDAEGRVRFALAEEHQTIVSARADERWGYGRWYVHDALREITIWPDNRTEIHVRHANGQPAAGVPLVVRALRGQLRRWGYRLPDTDAEGHTVALHLGPVTMGLSDRVVSGWAIEAAVPTSAPAEVLYVPRSTAGPLLIELPRVGSLEIEMVCAPGLRLPPNGWVTVAAHGLRSTTVGAPLGFGVPSGQAYLDEDGRAHMPYVEVGLDLDLEARFPNWKAATMARALGPVRDGETARAHLVLGSDVAVVRARAVNEDGTPLVGATLYVYVEELLDGVADYSNTHVLTTDTSGHFLVPVRAGELLAPPATIEYLGTRKKYRFASVYSPVPGRSPMGPEDRHTILDLSEDLPAGLHDRGDQILSPAAVLAAGRIVDTGGEPVDGVGVRVQPSGELGPKRPAILGYHAITDAAGRFVIYGHLPYERLELTHDGGGPDENVVIPRGATAIELRCPAEG